MSRPPRSGGAITSSIKWATASPTGPAPSRPPPRTPPNSRQTLGFGPGAAPGGDTGPLNGVPFVVPAVRPYDLHLQATSPAIGAGANLTGGGRGLLDFDGRPRPASGAWSMGAY